MPKTTTFAILTTAHLPEAYFLADFLVARRQRVALLSLIGRPLRDRLRVLARLRRGRGSRYLADVLLGRAARRLIVRDAVPPFPEIDGPTIARVRQSIAWRDCTDLHSPDTLDFVRRFEPEYVLLAGAPVIRPALYGLARVGGLNRHLGLAPAYRGSDCPLWALAMDEPEAVGFTIHRVSERVDGGDVIVQQSVPVNGDRGLGAYLARVQRAASEAFAAVLSDIVEGRPVRATTQHGAGRHYSPAGLTTLLRAGRAYARAAAVPAPAATRAA